MKMKENRSKVVYQDGSNFRSLIGPIVGEDDYFISIKLPRGDIVRISKRFIITIKSLQNRGERNEHF